MHKDDYADFYLVKTSQNLKIGVKLECRPMGGGEAKETKRYKVHLDKAKMSTNFNACHGTLLTLNCHL